MVEKLWGGRFEASLDKQTEEFGASIKFEQRLAPFDLKGSLAHVKMLGETGIITTEESQKIAKGLKKVEEKLLNGQIEFKTEKESRYGRINQRKNRPRLWKSYSFIDCDERFTFSL